MLLLPEEPITQIEADVPLESLSLQAENADLELDLHSYERLACLPSPFGSREHVPDWVDTNVMTLDTRPQSRLGKWIPTDLGVRAFQSLGKNSPSREQVVRRITRDLHTHTLIESLDCDLYPKATLHRCCLPGCGCNTPATRDIETCFMHRTHPLIVSHPHDPRGSLASLLPSEGRGGTTILFKTWDFCPEHHGHRDASLRAEFIERNVRVMQPNSMRSEKA